MLQAYTLIALGFACGDCLISVFNIALVVFILCILILVSIQFEIRRARVVVCSMMLIHAGTVGSIRIVSSRLSSVLC